MAAWAAHKALLCPPTSHINSFAFFCDHLSSASDLLRLAAEIRKLQRCQAMRMKVSDKWYIDSHRSGRTHWGMMRNTGCQMGSPLVNKRKCARHFSRELYFCFCLFLIYFVFVSMEMVKKRTNGWVGVEWCIFIQAGGTNIHIKRANAYTQAPNLTFCLFTPERNSALRIFSISINIFFYYDWTLGWVVHPVNSCSLTSPTEARTHPYVSSMYL